MKRRSFLKGILLGLCSFIIPDFPIIKWPKKKWNTIPDPKIREIHKSRGVEFSIEVNGQVLQGISYDDIGVYSSEDFNRITGKNNVN